MTFRTIQNDRLIDGLKLDNLPADTVSELASKLESVVAGTLVTIDNTDPLNPIINVTPHTDNLNELSDVVILTPLNGQVLLYNSTSGKWENTALTGGGDMLKATYDMNTNGIVDNSEALEGNDSAYHLSVDNHTDGTTNKVYTATEKTKLAGAEVQSNKGIANGYASLDAGGKIPEAQLPSITVSEYLGDFADLATALLNAGVNASQRGDWFTVQSNGGQTYIVTIDSPTLAGDVQLLKTPTDAVSSVNGFVGVVTLDTGDIAVVTDKNYVTDAHLVLLGNTSGSNTGDQTSVTGNAGTATILETARTINGISFNGSANISVPSDIAPGAIGNVLTSNGTVWTSDAPSGGGGAVTTLYGSTIGDILPSTETTIASFIAGQSGTLTSVRVDLDIAPTGSSATVDVYKNGSSIGVVTITAASTSGSQGTFSDTAVVAGAKYEFKATGGTTVRGGGSTYINFIIS